MMSLFADLRYACRVLLRAPSFTIAVILVLALGIGANTTIFSIVNAVLLKPLPFDDADRIVTLFHTPPQSAFPGVTRFPVSAANYYDWKRDAQSFEAMANYTFRAMTLSEHGEAKALLAAAVDPDFFRVMHARAALGRTFLPEEDTPAHGHVVILSDGFWKRDFAGAPDVVGRTLRLSDEPYTIVGVMPPQFTVPALQSTSRDVMVPMANSDEARLVRDNHNDRVVARLKPGVTIDQAQAEMSAISLRLAQQYPREDAGWGAIVQPLQDVVVGDVRLSLVMLLGAVALVLLIACANVGNLLFARTLARRKELAIRAALGAGRGRVFQQLLLEALLLAGLGGVAGLIVARLSLVSGAALLAAEVPRANEIAIDTRVLLFVIAASTLAGILAGAMPALRAGRADLTDALKEGGRHEGALGIRTRRALVIAEVALSLVLLTGAAVMGRSLLALRQVDTGFDPNGVLTMRLNLPAKRYESPARASAFFDTALERVRALPGVESAGAVDNLPVQGGSVQPAVVDGQMPVSRTDQPTVGVRRMTPGYLRTMRIPLVRGREPAPGDVNVMLVSRNAARLLWGDADPIGHTVTLPLESTTPRQIIGIVGDVKQSGDLADAPMPSVYWYTAERNWRSLAIVMRVAGSSPLAAAQPAAAIIHAIDADQPITVTETMQKVLDDTMTSQRFNALVLGLFAGVALLLASVGIYSVLSYIVRGRSREIGIRTALGASRTDVLSLVVAEGMTPALIGVVLGIIASLASARVLGKLVFGVSASDPLTLALAASALSVVALMASLLPAWRASRLDPLIALRDK